MTYVPCVQPNAEVMSVITSSHILRMNDVSNERIVHSSFGTENELIEKITGFTGCDIILKDLNDSFLIEQCVDCRIFVYSTASTITLRDCRNCHITLVCHTYSIFNCNEIVIRSLCTLQNGVIEINNSTKLLFLPVSLTSPSLNQLLQGESITMPTSSMDQLLVKNSIDAYNEEEIMNIQNYDWFKDYISSSSSKQQQHCSLQHLIFIATSSYQEIFQPQIDKDESISKESVDICRTIGTALFNPFYDSVEDDDIIQKSTDHLSIALKLSISCFYYDIDVFHLLLRYPGFCKILGLDPVYINKTLSEMMQIQIQIQTTDDEQDKGSNLLTTQSNHATNTSPSFSNSTPSLPSTTLILTSTDDTNIPSSLNVSIDDQDLTNISLMDETSLSPLPSIYPPSVPISVSSSIPLPTLIIPDNNHTNHNTAAISEIASMPHDGGVCATICETIASSVSRSGGLNKFTTSPSPTIRPSYEYPMSPLSSPLVNSKQINDDNSHVSTPPVNPYHAYLPISISTKKHTNSLDSTIQTRIAYSETFGSISNSYLLPLYSKQRSKSNTRSKPKSKSKLYSTQLQKSHSKANQKPPVPPKNSNSEKVKEESKNNDEENKDSGHLNTDEIEQNEDQTNAVQSWSKSDLESDSGSDISASDANIDDISFICLVDYYGTATSVNYINYYEKDDNIIMSSYGDLSPQTLALSQLDNNSLTYLTQNSTSLTPSLSRSLSRSLSLSHSLSTTSLSSSNSSNSMSNSTILGRNNSTKKPKKFFATFRKKDKKNDPNVKVLMIAGAPISVNRKLRPSKYEIEREKMDFGCRSTLDHRAALLENDSVKGDSGKNGKNSKKRASPNFDPPSSVKSKNKNKPSSKGDSHDSEGDDSTEPDGDNIAFADDPSYDYITSQTSALDLGDDSEVWNRFINQSRRRVSGFDGSQDELTATGLPRNVMTSSDNTTKLEDIFIPLSFDDALLNIKQTDLTEATKSLNLKQTITSYKNCTKFQIFVYKCVGKPKYELEDEPIVTFYLTLSNVVYLSNEGIHLTSLQSIYCSLEGMKQSVPDIGKHWLQIGFNNEDPSVDLANTGMFSVLNMLYLTDKYRDVAITLYRQSIQSRYEFKFVTICILASEVMLMFLKHPAAVRTRREFNNVHEMVGDMFCITLYNLIQIIQTGRHSADASTALRQEGLKSIIQNPRKLLVFFRSIITLCSPKSKQLGIPDSLEEGNESRTSFAE